MVNCAPKWRKIQKNKKKNIKNNPLVPAATVASRPPLSPPLIANLFSLLEPSELLHLSLL